MKNYKVVSHDLIKHTSAIHVSNTISMIDRKVSNILLKKAFPYLATREQHSINIKEIMALLEWSSDNNYELIKHSLKRLNSTQLEWNILKKDKKNEWGVSTIISGAKIKNGICEYSYSPLLRELLAMPNIYAKLNMVIQAKFNSKHSLALWEFLIEILCSANIDNVITNFINLTDLRNILGVSSAKMYDEFKILNRDVLKKAVAEINEISDINTKIITKKNGKKVVAIAFEISRKANFSHPLLNIKEYDASPLSTNDPNSNDKKNSLITELVENFNFKYSKAEEIYNKYSQEDIERCINYVNSQKEHKDIKNISAYFFTGLKEKWGAPSCELHQVNTHLPFNALEHAADCSPIWKNILANLYLISGEKVYLAWFTKLEFINISYEKNLLRLKTSSNFYKDWITANFLQELLKASQEVDPQIKEVEIIA